jgi:hypothetical protein
VPRLLCITVIITIKYLEHDAESLRICLLKRSFVEIEALISSDDATGKGGTDGDEYLGARCCLERY